MMRSPSKAGLVMMRARISCTRSNICLVARVGVLGDAVELQRLRGAAAALVERRDEPGAALGLLELILVHAYLLAEPSLMSRRRLSPRRVPPGAH